MALPLILLISLFGKIHFVFVAVYRKFIFQVLIENITYWVLNITAIVLTDK